MAGALPLGPVGNITDSLNERVCVREDYYRNCTAVSYVQGLKDEISL